MKRKKIRTIVSGGQTGADRAAFDFALAGEIRIEGFVPKGRLAEDGRIPEKYTNLRETRTADPAERTSLNVRRADATLIVSHGKLSGGSLLTLRLAKKYGKPFLHVDLAASGMDEAAATAALWLGRIGAESLNVAGPRASEDAEIYEKTTELLRRVFGL